jgi:hypothetical protein
MRNRINQLLTWLLTVAAIQSVASNAMCQASSPTNVASDPQAVRFAVAHQHTGSWCFGYLYVSPAAISYVVTTPAKDQNHSFTFQRSQITSVKPWVRDQQTLKAVRFTIGNTAYHFWWMPNEEVVQTGRPYQWNPSDAADPQQLIATILGPNGLPTTQQGAGAGLQPGAMGTGPAGPQGSATGSQDPLVLSAANALGSGTNQITKGKIGGRIGLGLANLTLEKSKSLGLSAASGALVELVEPNGPAEQAGVRIDDVITALNGARISKAMDVRMKERHLAPGGTAELLILRQGQLVKARVKLLR